jgi:hypothetical protein
MPVALARLVLVAHAPRPETLEAVMLLHVVS